VNVTSSVVGAYTNTIPAGALTSTQGATNGAAASAVLTVVRAPNVTLSKAFAPGSISANGTSTLTITVANTAAGAVALTGLTVSDAAGGVTVAAARTRPRPAARHGPQPPAARASRCRPAASAPRDLRDLGNVTSGCRELRQHDSGGNVASNQGASNAGAATADLKVIAPGVTISKAFSPATIHPHGTSR